MKHKFIIFFALFALVFGQSLSAVHIIQHSAEVQATLQDHEHGHDSHDTTVSCWLCDYAQSTHHISVPNSDEPSAMHPLQGSIIIAAYPTCIKPYQYTLYNPRSPPVSLV